ncbi:GATA transcription factor 6-like [Impatiens glandulifera]|uniref:GATA transcription factor 6-like n=1 Tax=Impatiens glandulifera TaxID=253017 RepID=UPI001FB19781|nr:GATA transcription factor 6-like [Impatiens glandulifera]
MEYCINELDMTTLQSTIPLDSSTFHHLDDFFSLNSGADADDDNNNVDGVDFSSIDSFLDLSDDHHHQLLQEDQWKEEVSNSQDKPGNIQFTTTSFPGGDSHVVEFPLLQQVEDFEDLEWLSRIVDDYDSDSKLTLLYNPPINHHHHHRSHPPPPPPPLLCFSCPIPAKPRTKRTRLAGKLWGNAVTAALSNSSSSSSSSSIISYGSSNSSISSNTNLTIPMKNQMKKRGWSELESETQIRRCSHCHVQKTPQWRSGPLGPKTLCNACGVRFKSGKLFPEYRPACSPSFTGELHSNSHRKVLEMRRKKETIDKPGQVSF